jgi:hypothetical protein
MVFPLTDEEILSMRLLHMAALSLVLLNAAAIAADAQPSVESVKQLLDAIGTKNTLNTVQSQIDSMMKLSMQQALGQKPMSPAQNAIMEDMRVKMIAIINQQMSWEKLEPSLLEIYRKTFTQKEVDGMLVFYRSDVGKAVVAKLPQAMMSSMQMAQGRMSTLLPQIQQLGKDTAEKLKAAESNDGKMNAAPTSPASPASPASPTSPPPPKQ